MKMIANDTIRSSILWFCIMVFAVHALVIVAFPLTHITQWNSIREVHKYSDLKLLASGSSNNKNNKVIPIDASGWPDRFPAKEHCSKCGLCETTFVSHVKDACAFLGDGMGRIDSAEVQVHGRGRDLSSMVWSDKNNNKSTDSKFAEEARFGVLYEPMKLVKGRNIPNAQWTGVVTGIALSMLESGMVDAVVCIANKNDQNKDSGQWTNPEPIIARTPEEVLKGRGVKPALAPSLKILDEFQRDSSIRKLLFCGVGCAVQGEFIHSSTRYCF